MKKELTYAERLTESWLLYLSAEHGLTDQEMAEHFGVNHTTAWRMRVKLRCNEIVSTHYGLEPTENVIKLMKAVLSRADKR